jgi:hypothetical protein
MSSVCGTFQGSEALCFVYFTIMRTTINDSRKVVPLSRHQVMEACAGTVDIVPCTHTVETGWNCFQIQATVALLPVTTGWLGPRADIDMVTKGPY